MNDITDAVCLCLLSKGFRVKFIYSEHYDISVTLTLDGVADWDGDGGEEGARYAQRIIACARELADLRERTPPGVFKTGFEAARALLRLSAMKQY